MLVRIKILDILRDPDTYFVMITVGSRVRYERVDERTSRQYRLPIHQALEALALEYGYEIDKRVVGVMYE